jgi:hypothetical protein
VERPILALREENRCVPRGIPAAVNALEEKKSAGKGRAASGKAAICPSGEKKRNGGQAKQRCTVVASPRFTERI